MKIKLIPWAVGPIKVEDKDFPKLDRYLVDIEFRTVNSYSIEEVWDLLHKLDLEENKNVSIELED